MTTNMFSKKKNFSIKTQNFFTSLLLHFHPQTHFSGRIFATKMAQVELNEGNGEDNELMEWLEENKLLKAKQQFIEYEITMDDLKSLDLKHDLTLTNYIKYK